MKNFVLREKLTALLTVLMAVCLSVCALMFAIRYAPLAADEKVAVTSAASGKVSLGELCERHDVLHIIAPASYRTDASLKSYVDTGRFYNAESMLNIDADGVLHGWATTAPTGPSSLEKTLLVMPKTFKSVNYNVGNALNSPNHIFAGIAFENGGALTEFHRNLFRKNPSDKADLDLENVRFVVLSDTITKLKDQAFYGWNQLQEIVMPAVTTIGAKAFGRTCSLRHISISDKVTSIASDAFEDAVGLVDVEINSDAEDKIGRAHV